MTNSIYSLLNKEAKNWWWFAELRKQGKHTEARVKERESIRRHITTIRQALLDGGYFNVGRGGWSVHSYNTTLSGYGDVSAPIIQAAIRMGLKGIDSTTIPEDLIVKVIGLPLIGIRIVDKPPYCALDRASFEYVAGKYKELGATIYNCEDL